MPLPTALRAQQSAKFNERFDLLCLLHRGETSVSEVWLCACKGPPSPSSSSLLPQPPGVFALDPRTCSFEAHLAPCASATGPEAAPQDCDGCHSSAAPCGESSTQDSVTADEDSSSSSSSPRHEAVTAPAKHTRLERLTAQMAGSHSAKSAVDECPVMLTSAPRAGSLIERGSPPEGQRRVLKLASEGESRGEASVQSPATPRRHVACKIVRKSALRNCSTRECFQREVALMQELSGKHPGIVRLQEVVETENSIRLVMELCKGGSLRDLLELNGRLPEPAAKLLFGQLASAVAFCHGRSILHRNLAAEYVLLTSPASCLYRVMSPPSSCRAQVSVRLCKLGSSVDLSDGARVSGLVGNQHYSPPEMLKGKKYGLSADVWSLGVLLSYMLSGKLPFAGSRLDDFEGLRLAILCGTVDVSGSEWEGVSDGAKGLVEMMLKPDGSERPSAGEVLSHPWLRDPSEERDSASLPQSQAEEGGSRVSPGQDGYTSGAPVFSRALSETGAAQNSPVRRESKLPRLIRRGPANGTVSSAAKLRLPPLVLEGHQRDVDSVAQKKSPSTQGPRSPLKCNQSPKTGLSKRLTMQKGMWSRLGERETRSCMEEEESVALEMSMLLAEVQ